MKFIRKNGHVIPIREPNDGRPQAVSSPGHKNLVAGAALTTAGAAVATASGWAAGNMVKAAAGAENEARKAYGAFKQAGSLGPLFASSAAKSRQLFGKNVRLRNTLWRSSLNVRTAGFVTGSALVGVGVERGLSEAPGFKDHATARAAVAGGVAVSTHFAIRHAFERYMGGRGLKVVRSAASFTLRGFARKFTK